MVGCSVVGCKARSSLLDDVSFYKFPSNEALKQKWMIASGLPESKLSKHQRICSNHFTTDSFRWLHGKKALKSASIPTLNVHGPESIFDGNTENMKRNVKFNMRDTKRNINLNRRGTKRKLDEDTEVINENSDVEEHNVNSETEGLITEVMTDGAEMIVKPEKLTMNVNTLVRDNNLPPEIRKLIFQLQRKAQVAESQKTTIARLKARIFRLSKKNQELTATIEIMKNEALKDHKGPSILLVGM